MSEHKHEKKILEFNSDFDDIIKGQNVQNTTQPKPREPSYIEAVQQSSVRKSESRDRLQPQPSLNDTKDFQVRETPASINGYT